MEIMALNGPQLAEEFNRLADLKGYERVKRFPDLETGRRRLAKLIAAPSALTEAAQEAVEQKEPPRPPSQKKETQRPPSQKPKKASVSSWRAKGIRLVADKNPRQVGTKAYALYDAMAAYVKKHPDCTVDDVLKNTTYRRQDHVWDLKRGFIEEKSV